MKYAEILKLYKEGRLPLSEKEQVERDIEKQEAISDFLFDMDETGLEELFSADGQGEKNFDDSEENFLRLVKKSIRNSFIKMGIAVGASVLFITLLIIFVLPEAVDKFYYDPNQVVGVQEDNSKITTDRMSLDMACYSELFMPQSYRNEVIAGENGFGCYDITIPQIVYSPKNTLKTVNGTLERNKLILYDTDTLKHISANSFIPPSNGENPVSYDTAPLGSKEDAKRFLEQKPKDIYGAFISLEKACNYEDAISWLYGKNISEGAIWCAVYHEDKSGEPIVENIGFKVANSGICLDWDREKYPILSLLDNSGKSYDLFDEESMKTHFLSLLSYIRDNREICRIMRGHGSDNDGFYEDLTAYVKSEGLKIHGFYIEAERDELLKLWEDEKVSYIYAVNIY